MLCIRCKSEIDKSFRACPHCGEPITEFTRRYTDELLDGKYRIIERLGAGGMGEVYKAEHTYLGATRVIKVIRPQISESKDAHDRFLREARVATRVQHQNVATMHDFSGLPDGSHYMVTEFIDGENLAQRLRARTTLPPRAAVRLAIQALHGLDAIHRAGIVHRDISPENLMITRESDTVKIIDLGVAKVEDPSEVAATRTGIFVGKLRYAAPEQLGFLGDDERLDSRADIYAMGMVLYEMLAGRPPFEATSPHQFYLHHSEEKEFQPVDLPADLPGGIGLQAALRKALQRDRNKRFQSAREFATALEEVEKSLPDPGAMRTMALALVTPSPAVRDTLHRTTQRDQITQAARVPPPPPPAPAPRPPAAPTQITSIAQAAPPRKGTPVLAVATLFMFLIGAVAFAAWYFTRDREPKPPLVADATTPTTTTMASVAPATIAPPAPAPVPSATTLDITTNTAPPPITTTTAAPPVLAAPVRTTTVAPAPVPVPTTTTHAPPPVTTTTAAPVERPAPPVERAEPAEETDDTTYLVRGDEDANEKVIERLRESLKGTRRIAVRGGSMQSELERAILDELPFLEIADNASVVIDFDGRLEDLPRGRKARTARATIRKNGRVVFRYILQREMYRVGNTPAEAFVAAVADAFEE